MSTYSNLKIEIMTTGQNSSTWGNVTNTNLGTAIEEAITGSADIAFSSGSITLTLTDTNTSQTARNLRLNLTGAGGFNLIVPAIEKTYIVNNGTDGTITIKNTTGTGIAIPAGKSMWVFNTGANVVDVTTYLSSLALGTPLSTTSGGTGSNSTAYCNLTTNVVGALPAANGGTGLAAFNISSGSYTVGFTNGSSNITGTGLPPAGTPVQFTTTGTLPTNFALSTTYYVVLNTGGTTVGVAATIGGTAIVAGSAGTGTHTMTSYPPANNAIYSTGTTTLAAGTLPIAAGGTGAITATEARASLGAAGTGVNTDITALDQDVTVTATGTIAADSIGYRGLPRSTNTTLALSDAGKHIYTASNITIPANSSAAFPVGTTIVIANSSGSATLTISITTDTLYQAGTTNTGTRTLAIRGIATLVKVTSTSWYISGNLT
jgi:hypothetical protein